MGRALKLLIEGISWIAIAASPTLIGGLIALILYSKYSNSTISILILIVGFLVGAIWATRITLKYGASEWISRIRRIT